MSVFIKNKKAFLKYEVLENLEAGIKLLGFEVKAVKSRRGSLDGSHITVRGGEALLIGFNLPPYQANNTPEGYNPERHRRLLLNKKEIDHLAHIESQKGLTIIPISVYNKGRKIKIELAIVRGKKKYDKRETLKKKDTQREIDREMKSRNR